MIRVKFYEKKDGTLYGFTFRGHAGYAASGSDILCSAVSILGINTVNAVESFTNDRFQSDMEESDGYLSFKICSRVSPESLLLLKTLRLGIEGIAAEYGSQYVKISMVTEDA